MPESFSLSPFFPLNSNTDGPLERERARGGRTDKAHTAAEIEEMRAPKSPLSSSSFSYSFFSLIFPLGLVLVF